MAVVIETTLGDITIDLYVKERPKTCLNFLKLCKIKYYNFNLFHLVQRGFIGQTGDPTGTGRGGESIHGILYGEQARYYEAEKVPRIKHSKPGTVSMVNCGEQLLGSQWFITLGADLDYLDGEHCAFGEVVEGLEILDKLNEVISDDDGRPFQDVRITHTVILDDPFDDPPGLGGHIPSRSPSPSKEMLDSGRIAADEDIDDTQGKTLEEMDEIIQEKEAKARATILEMVGDIPEADCAPPENVLFVCKLNPVTTDEDLEIIFSRFGKIVSCEVIRDQKSGESLQYAFIEFEDRKACEDAYFKMDNVLIDDRRIHVDFSQSVAKYKWKGKGRGVEVFKDKNEPGGGAGRKDKSAHAPWLRGGGREDLNRKNQGQSDGSSHIQNRDRARYSNIQSQRSRSPPGYSRRDPIVQNKKEKEKVTDSKKSMDDKLRELLKKELEKKKKDESSSSSSSSSESSSSESDSSSSTSSSSSSDSDNHKKNKKPKSKKRRKK